MTEPSVVARGTMHSTKQPMNIDSIRSVHMVGIGGAGMCGIAEVLLRRGYRVTGSDLEPTEVTARLESLGATVWKGHSRGHVKDADLVVFSSAIISSNPELQAASERKIPALKRSAVLALLMRNHLGICVAGTHGKTTTTSLIGHLFREARLDPTIIIGGRPCYLDGNARAGDGDHLIVEADEFDRSFLELSPSIAVITNIELEHLDCYESLQDIKQAFLEFASRVPSSGFVVVCLDDPGVQEIIPRLDTCARVVSYGIENPQATFQALAANRSASEFQACKNGAQLGQITLRCTGEHNIANALAAIAVGSELSLPFAIIKAALEAFDGVSRRFEIRGKRNGITVADDYAHHPTEIRATLKTARQRSHQRVISVFQPHLYSRTQAFCNDFARSFYQADIVIITDIYPSREQPIEGVSGRLIADAARQYKHRNVHYIPNKRDVPNFLEKIAVDGDLVLTLGAGDIGRYGEQFLKSDLGRERIT